MSIRRLLVIPALAVAAAAFTATPAFALNTHVFSSAFAGSGTNTLASPTDVAVDNSAGPSTGDVYVTDPGHFRIEKFDSTGKFILMFGKGVNETKDNTPSSTEAEKNVCTAASSDTCKAGVSGSTPGAFTTPQWVDVDGSSGPSAGDVYVGDTGDGIISKFDESGNLLVTWGTKGQLSGFGGLNGIAVDPTGNLFIETGGISWYEQSGTLHSTFCYPRGVSPVDWRLTPKTIFTRLTAAQM